MSGVHLEIDNEGVYRARLMSLPVYFDFSTQVYSDVDDERARAHKKHGAKGNSREDAHWTNNEWLPILMEEVGEAAHELTYDAKSVFTDNQLEAKRIELRKELVQVAAMACAWIEAIDRA